MRIAEATLNKYWRMKMLSIILHLPFLSARQIKIECLNLNKFPAVTDVGIYHTTQCNTSKKGFSDNHDYLLSIRRKASNYFNIANFYWNTERITDEKELKRFMLDNKSFTLFLPHLHKRNKTVFTGFKFTYYKKKLKQHEKRNK